MKKTQTGFKQTGFKQTGSKQATPSTSYPATGYLPIGLFPMLNGPMPVPLRSAEQIGRTMMDVQNELVGFLGRRLEANTRAWQSFSACSSWSELVAAQQDWLETARNDYVDETGRITQMNRRILDTVVEASTSAGEAGQAAAEQAAGHAGNGRSGDGKSG